MKGYFRSSRVTPSIYFDPSKGLFDMRDKSSPENPLSFFNYVLESLDKYAKNGVSTMTVNLSFEYFNTSSSKCLYVFMKKLSKIDEMGKKVIVNWYYEDGDEDMKEAGEDLCSFFDMEFNFLEIPEIKVLGEEKQSA